MKWLSAKQDPALKALAAQLPSRFLSAEEQVGFPRAEILARLLEFPYPLEHELFIAQTDAGEAIASFGLQVSPFPGVGFVGLLALSPDPRHGADLDEAWERAEEWFRARGMKRVVGPLTYATWFPYRFRKDQDPRRFGWEPAQPRRDYLKFLSWGFRDEAKYASSSIGTMDAHLENTRKDYDKSTAAGYRYRGISESDLGRDLPVLHQLVLEAFKKAHWYTPLSYEAFQQIYVPNMKSTDLSLSCMMESPEGKPLGFFFMFRDGDALVMKTAGILDEARGKGLYFGASHWCMLKAREQGINRLIFPLYHVDNTSARLVGDLPLDWEHEYVLVEKDLA